MRDRACRLDDRIPSAPPTVRLPAETVLRLCTEGSAWLSSESGRKGALKVGQHADVAALSADCLAVPESQIKAPSAVLTGVGGLGGCRPREPRAARMATAWSRCAWAQPFTKASRSALSTSASTVGMPCDRPG
ncbi:amidohydrolase family protein [Rubrivivax sp. RP6-9]|uniref:amidohydrolase family protein n=1 Tax=Rubrivivax sp. RP6-9 TaxID=3415750 RepID=UPI003CC6B6B6